MEEKLTISILTSELEKLGVRMLEDLENFLVESDGNLKDIEVGTRIRIPLGAGSVSCSIYATDCLTIQVYLKESLMKTTTQTMK